MIKTNGILSPHPADIHTFIYLLHITSSLIASSLSVSSFSSASLFSSLLTLLDSSDIQNNPDFYNSILLLLNHVLTDSLTHSLPPSPTSTSTTTSSSSSSGITGNEGNIPTSFGEEEKEYGHENGPGCHGYWIRSILVYLSKRLSVGHDKSINALTLLSFASILFILMYRELYDHYLLLYLCAYSY